MTFCRNCGARLNDDNVSFCTNCGTPTGGRQVSPMEQQEFLTVTGRLLRWEKKAWHIGSLVFALVGVIIFAIFSMIALISGIFGNMYIEEFMLFFFVYGLLLGGVGVAFGIANYVMVGKVSKYENFMTTGFAYTQQRCESIGMIVYCVFFNPVSLVFFLINFIRMKANRHVVQSILHSR